MRPFKGRFCKFVFCAMLGGASIGGALLRPEEVEELMYIMNQPKIAHTLPDEAENGDDLVKKLLGYPATANRDKKQSRS
jgi:hypothetical protein